MNENIKDAIKLLSEALEGWPQSYSAGYVLVDDAKALLERED